jgi:hypothetical protein
MSAAKIAVIDPTAAITGTTIAMTGVMTGTTIAMTDVTAMIAGTIGAAIDNQPITQNSETPAFGPAFCLSAITIPDRSIPRSPDRQMN